MLPNWHLSNVTLPNFPKAHSHTDIFAYTSEISCKAEFQQQDGKGVFQPLKFFSKSFTEIQVNYSTLDQALLAAYLAVQHFAYFLDGRTITLYTGHKPIVGALAKHRPSISSRHSRQSSFTAEFTSDIRHTPGNANVATDCFSRPEVDALFSFVSNDSSAFAIAQAGDSELQVFLKSDPP